MKVRHMGYCWLSLYLLLLSKMCALIKLKIQSQLPSFCTTGKYSSNWKETIIRILCVLPNCYSEKKTVTTLVHMLLFDPSDDVLLVSTLVSAPYSGCMEVSVNGRPLDLDQALHKHNDIRSHSCPLLDSHQ